MRELEKAKEKEKDRKKKIIKMLIHGALGIIVSIIELIAIASGKGADPIGIIAVTCNLITVVSTFYEL